MQKLILFNQAAGSLFLQLAIGLSCEYPDGCRLVAGGDGASEHLNSKVSRLEIRRGPSYDRRSRFARVFSWVRYAFYSTTFVLFARKREAILFVSNPPLLGPWVWLLSHIRRVPYAVLVYDIHPDVLTRLGVLRERGLPARLWRALNRRVYRRAAAVVTLGDRMADVLQRQIGESGPRVEVVPPWVDVSVIRPLARRENPYADTYTPSTPLVVLYSGNMGASHDIDSILEAARLLKDEQNIFFLLVGRGEKYSCAVEFVSRHQLQNIRVLPFQPEERFPYTLALGDIALVALDEGMEDLMVPSKTFFSLAAGSALIAISREESELSDVLEKSDIGVRVSPRRPADLAKEIRELASDPGRLARMRSAARSVAEECYSRDAGVKSFLAVLDKAGLGPSAN